jgi:hypothetical protein
MISYTISYTIHFYLLPEFTVARYDTLCLVAPYPFRLEPLDEFDPLCDFEMTGGDDVWFCLTTIVFFVQPVPYWTDGRQEFPSGGLFDVLQHI